ncbi:galectin-4-like [Tubulanus polymorphus]|uniref:galectin-4-like n=1 Tax=Tubulanus polymorphus TaxID=672921 RepID=UPI003DA39DCC
MYDIHNPRIPYTGIIPGGVRDGTMITIRGSTTFSKHFSIGLHDGSPSGNAILYLNPRIDEGCIVRNSFYQNKWGAEERDGGMPIYKSSPFEIMILVQRDCFMIAVNGTHFAKFHHRFPKESATTLQITGSVHIKHIHYPPAAMAPGFPPVPPAGPTGPGIYPPPAGSAFPGGCCPPPPRPPPAGFAPPTQSHMPNTFFNPPLPFTHKVVGGLKEGNTIQISGKTKHHGQRWTINLTSDKQKRDIALHFDVRIHMGFHQKVVVMNSSLAGQWQTEEHDSTRFPFKPGHQFDLSLRVNPTGYQIYVNGGQHCYSFGHRHPFRNVKFVNIEGDIDVTTLSIM